ncbi:MAG: sigma-70 family RNA polymerase sigma factor [Bacteroidota bacterium]
MIASQNFHNLHGGEINSTPPLHLVRYQKGKPQLITSSTSESREEEIIRLLRIKNTQALRLIDAHYQKALFGVIYKIVGIQELAEDAWQESLVKIWRFADQFDPNKGRLFTWLINICRRTAIDKVRSRDFREQKSGQDINETSSQTETVNQDLSEELFVEGIGVKEFVQKLDPKYQEVIDLLYFKGHTQQEAAKELALPLGTVKTRIRTGINLLRKWMGN